MRSIFCALRLTLILMILCSGAYTLVVWGAAQCLPGKGRGQRIQAQGRSYYANIGQSFTQDKYVHGRPSAVQYNAAGSGGSNKGPYDSTYLQTVQGRIDRFLKQNPTVKRSDIPVELVTASGSGLDPDLPVKAAQVQAARIAMARNIPVQAVLSVIESNTERPFLGLLGPEKVNVLRLNLALDRIFQQTILNK